MSGPTPNNSTGIVAPSLSRADEVTSSEQQLSSSWMKDGTDTAAGRINRKISALQDTKWNLTLLLITTALFAVTAWFAQSTFSASSVDRLR